MRKLINISATENGVTYDLPKREQDKLDAAYALLRQIESVLPQKMAVLCSEAANAICTVQVAMAAGGVEEKK